MYLICDPDGYFYKTTYLSDETLALHSEGDLDIVNDRFQLLTAEGKWENLPDYEE